MRKLVFILVSFFIGMNFAFAEINYSEVEPRFGIQQLLEDSQEVEANDCYQDGCPGSLVCYNGVCSASGPSCQSYEDCAPVWNVCHNGICYI